MSLLEGVERDRPSFAASLAHHGSQLAVASSTASVSYAELAGRVEAAAEQLGSGRRLVLLAGANQLDALIGYLAALHGGHPVLLAPGGNEAHLERMIGAFDPDVLLTEAAGWAVEERRSGSAHELHPDLALLLSTSGSTGSPRLVRLSRRNLYANASAIARYLDLTPSDRGVTSLPMHYCYGLSVVNSHLASGAGIVLTDRSVVDPCFWQQVRHHEVTGLAAVPHTFDLLDRVGFEEMALPSLRYVTQAGGRLSPDRVQRYAALGQRDGWELFVMYGQTEATARMAYLPPSLAASHPTTIGVPIPGGILEIEPVEGSGPDEGELVYWGDNVMLGYADGPGDLARGATIEALHTGDLARVTRDGLYEIVGRRSRFAKVFGLRIDLDHLEARLDARSIEALCASDDHRVVIAITDDQHAVPARAAVQAESGLPASRIVVEVLARLPRLPSGKPDHVTVARLASGTYVRGAGAPVVGSQAPDVDPQVHQAFVKVLQRSDITGDATFVGLGGDSLSYVEMSIALEDCLGELPADWHTTPIRDLVAMRGPARRLRQTEMSVVLRAVAIVAVVGTHIKLFNVLGGAHLLLGIGGYNFARFPGRPSDRARSIARIAMPSMVWLAVTSMLDDRIQLAHVLLLNGWLGGEDAHGGYWYVEAIVQILVPLSLLLSNPAVHRIERSHRSAVPLAVLFAGLLVRFHVVELPTVEPHDIRPQDIFWIFALGWVVAEARSTTARVLVSGLIVLSVPGYFGEPARELVVAGGLLLLLWVPTVPLIRAATRLVGSVAAASLYIYLTHWQVFPPLREHFGPVVALVGSIVAGVAAWSAVRSISLAARRRGHAVGTAAGVAEAGSPSTASSA